MSHGFLKKRNAVEQVLDCFLCLTHTKLHTGTSEQQQDTSTSPGIQLLSQIRTRPNVNLIYKSKISLHTPLKHGGIAPRFLNLDTRSLYPRDATPIPSEYETRWAAEPVWAFFWGKKYCCPLPAFDPRTVQPLAQLLYRWRQPGSRRIKRAFQIFVMFHSRKTALLCLIHGQSELDVRYAAGTSEWWVESKACCCRVSSGSGERVSSCLFNYTCFVAEMYVTTWSHRGCQQCSYCRNLQSIWEAIVYVVMWYRLL